MNALNMLAFDLGASNGRVVLGILADGHLELKEIHRFENNPVTINGKFYWDVIRLFYEMKQGILKCKEAGYRIDSIGVNTWGNTVGILDKDGDLLLNPIHYRDTSAHAVLPELYETYSPAGLFEQTLYKPMSIQPTVYLHYLVKTKPWLMKNADCVLMISDLFNYFLTGKKKSEQTMAATSQMLDMRTLQWKHDFMEALGIRPDLFPEIVHNGTVLGEFRPELVKELDLPNTPVVVSVAGHDTASAASCIPMEHMEDSLYLSSGTWSCMGCRVKAPIEDIKVFENGITNDTGILGTMHLRFNHTGLWILQECRRDWNNNHKLYSWDDIGKMAAEANPFTATIDTEDSLFFSQDHMPDKITEFCRKSCSNVPKTDGEIVRTIMESLAFRYRFSVEQLEKTSGTCFGVMHIIGGGSKNGLLCQFIANTVNREVVAGPAEATVFGNFMLQGMALGKIGSLKAGQELVVRSTETIRYQPHDAELWDKMYRERTIKFPWPEA